MMKVILHFFELFQLILIVLNFVFAVNLKKIPFHLLLTIKIYYYYYYKKNFFLLDLILLVIILKYYVI